MKCQMYYCCSPQQPPLSETEAVLDPLQGIYQRSPNTDISTTDGDIKRTGIFTASTDTIIENQEAQAKLYAFGNAFSYLAYCECLGRIVLKKCTKSDIQRLHWLKCMHKIRELESVSTSTPLSCTL